MTIVVIQDRETVDVDLRTDLDDGLSPIVTTWKTKDDQSLRIEFNLGNVHEDLLRAAIENDQVSIHFTLAQVIADVVDEYEMESISKKTMNEIIKDFSALLELLKKTRDEHPGFTK